MILLVDIGNSRIKWSGLKDGRLGGMSTADNPQKDFSAFAELVWRPLLTPQRVLVSSVAGDAMAKAVTAWVEHNWRIAPEFIHPAKQAYGVENAYTDPTQMGPDRWAALVAARHSIEDHVCIVDCGTAMTVDVLTIGGRHLGGMIAPGIAMMRRSLNRGTRGIPESAALAQDDNVFGDNTASCVHKGTLNAAVAFVERAFFATTALFEHEGDCIITGGDATDIMPFLTFTHRHEPDLVLKGLAVIAEHTA